MPRSDAELLIASRDDPAAFRELYDRWAERLLAYFYRRVLDPEVAADLLAETFAVAFVGSLDAESRRVIVAGDVPPR
jgi:RNA polymerase sigma-70 factor (ECF subfamily)